MKGNLLMKKYSKKFENDYAFYLRLSDEFTFSGKSDKELLSKVYACENGSTAKEAFFVISSTGKSVPVHSNEIEQIKAVLAAKASINLHIKIWSEMINAHVLNIDELKQDFPWFEDWIWKAIKENAKKLATSSKRFDSLP